MASRIIFSSLYPPLHEILATPLYYLAFSFHTYSSLQVNPSLSILTPPPPQWPCYLPRQHGEGPAVHRDVLGGRQEVEHEEHDSQREHAHQSL